MQNRIIRIVSTIALKYWRPDCPYGASTQGCRTVEEMSIRNVRCAAQNNQRPTEAEAANILEARGVDHQSGGVVRLDYPAVCP